MSYDLVLGNTIQIQYTTNLYPTYEDEDSNLPNSTKLTALAKASLHKENINTGHQTVLSDRVILCKSKAPDNDNDKDNSRDVQQRISAGGSLEKESDGKVNSQADISYSLSSKDRDNDKELKGSVRAGVEDRNGKTSCNVRVDIDYSF